MRDYCMDKNTSVGLIASILATLASLPQLIKMVKNKKAGDISLLWILILITGLAGWVYYGILKKDLIIIIANSLGIIINVTLSIFAVRYKNHPSKQVEDRQVY